MARGQDVIELLKGSDEIKLDGSTGNYIITGNVVFKKDNAKLYCDSAYYNLVYDNIRAYGNVQLNKQDTLNMFCDSLFFDTNKNFAKLYGNVRIRDSEYKLTTDSMDYDLDKNVGIYKNKGKITSITSSDELTSVVGYFYPESKQFNFRKNVVYKSDDYTVTTDTLEFNGYSKKAYFFGPTEIKGNNSLMYCEKGWYDINNNTGVLQENAFIDREDLYIAADSLYYSAEDSIYIGNKNVSIKDTANSLAFQGDYAINDQKNNYSFITGHALAKRYDDEDTLYIHADTLHNRLDSVGEPVLIECYYGVQLFRGDMQGVCDSLTYNRESGEMNLYTTPVLWAKEAQLSGDTISIYEKDNQIERAFLRKQGLIITHVDSTDYYNQVAGTILNAYFDSSEIHSVEIERNAKTIYFLEDEEETDSTIIIHRKGMNRIYSSSIRLGFEGGDIETATYIENPDGVLYPMDKIKSKEERVEQFKWNPKRRPLSWQFMIFSEQERATILHIFQVMCRPFIPELKPNDEKTE